MRGTTITKLLGTATFAAALLVPGAAHAAETKTAAVGAPAATTVAYEPATRTGGVAVLALRAPRGGGPTGPIDSFINCPPGYHPSPFEMPVYDDDGLFVIGYETVWFCIPDDLEPAG